MKTLYFVLLALSAYAACPNLCSGHGSCNQDGTCTCNRQPGLGLNKGAFDEFAWTGYDCSERTCPKGMTFSFDGEVTKTTNTNIKTYGELNTNVQKTERVRLLFESDNDRKAAAEAAEGEGTPTEAGGDDGGDSQTTTTASPTPVNTTSPPIITEAPIIATEAPTVPISGNISSLPLDENLPILKDLPDDVEYVVLRCYLGKNLDIYLGEMTIEMKEGMPNTSALLDKFGINDANAIINCNIPYTSSKVSKPSALNPKDPNEKSSSPVEIITSSGKVVKDYVYQTELNSDNVNVDDIISKLKDVYGDIIPDTKGRMLNDNASACYGIGEGNKVYYEYLCVESENPNDGASFYRMQKIPGQVKCENNSLLLQVSVNEMDNIDGICYFFGDVETQLPYSEIYPWIGKSDGYYYFARFNQKAATIVSAINDGEGGDLEGDTTITLDLKTVPSMVVKSGNSYSYTNRPVGDIEVATTPGAPMTLQIYDRDTGTFSLPIKTTVQSAGISSSDGGLKLTITVSPSNPIANNGTLIEDEDDNTNADDGENETPTGRALWEDYQGRMLEVIDPLALVVVETAGPHAFMECSGRGNCNRETGQCECYEGFEGDACQRTSCPNNCNNNGRCVEMQKEDPVKQTSNDVGKDNFESKFYGCECDGGFRGPDCSLIECPSDKDPNGATNGEGGDDEYRDCSGRGICDYTTGICKCFSGYYGSGCETQAMLQ